MEFYGKFHCSRKGFEVPLIAHVQYKVSLSHGLTQIVLFYSAVICKQIIYINKSIGAEQPIIQQSGFLDLVLPAKRNLTLCQEIFSCLLHLQHTCIFKSTPG